MLQLLPLASLLTPSAAAVVDALPGAALVLQGSGMAAANAEARALFGLSGDAPSMPLPLEDAAQWPLLQAAPSGEAELHLMTAQGPRWHRLQWRPLPDAAGPGPALRLLQLTDAQAGRDAAERSTASTAQVDDELRQRTLHALHDSEQRFQQFAERSDDVFWFADLSRGELLYVSPGFERLWGRPVEDLLGDATVWHQAVVPEDRQRLPQPFFADPVPQALREYRVHGAAGRLLWLRDRRFALPAADGQPCCVGGILENITERKRQESERDDLLERERSARAEAEALAVAKDEFLSVVSHELRSPLNAIRGWAHVLRKMLPDEPAQLKPLDAIDRNVAVQARMVDDLLDTQRLLRGKVTLHRQPTPLAQLAERALDTVRAVLQDKGLALRVSLPEPPLMLDVDAERLAQALVHLLSNAVKFTNAPGYIALSAERRGDGGVALVVSDSGVGLAPERRDALFQPFGQANASRTRSQGGLGLGLTLARQLVQLHGGRLVAHSEGPDRGSSFTIELPEAAVRVDQAAPPADAGPAVSLRGRRITVVDDDPQARQILELLLRDEAVQAQFHASAAEAYDHLNGLPREQWPEVLISDIAMPEEDGYSLIRRVRELGRQRGQPLPAVAVTAFTSPVDRRRALDAGFDAHLGKPMDPEQLRRTLHLLLQGAAAGLTPAQRAARQP